MKALSLLLVVMVGCGGSDFGYAPAVQAGGAAGDAEVDNWADTAGSAGSTPDADLPDRVGDALLDTMPDTLGDTADAGGTGGSAGGAGVGGDPAGGTGGQPEAGTGGTAAGGAAGTGGTGGVDVDAGGGTAGSVTGGAGGATGGTGGSSCPQCGALEECSPAGICVPKTVSLTGFGIDATEVTRSQYAAWLATGPSLAAQQGVCSSNASWDLGVDASCQLNMASDAPVTCVSWCQADAFCRDVGKRLCGQIGGGSTDYNVTDSAQAQWFNACSLGGEMTGCVLATTEPASVASSATCQTTAGVYDLLGSVQEWIDSCQTGTDKCRYRGGSFTSPEPGSCSWYNYFNRFAQYQNIGFRCCSNP